MAIKQKKRYPSKWTLTISMFTNQKHTFRRFTFRGRLSIDIKENMLISERTVIMAPATRFWYHGNLSNETAVPLFIVFFYFREQRYLKKSFIVL